MSIFMPSDHIFWSLPLTKLRQLKGDTKADVVIIGGGMAGLSAAQQFKNKGCSVIVLEKTFCGAGASGKSSGFITPDSEFSLGSFVNRLGKDEARHIWEFVLAGIESIKQNIEEYDLSCDYQKQDTLVVATSAKGFATEIEPEDRIRKELGYDSILYTQDTLDAAVGARDCFGAYRYSNTFGINGYQYLQGLKEVLIEEGVQIYEETPVLSFKENVVSTSYGNVEAKFIAVCADRWIPDFGRLVYDISHVQTFLMVSAPLSDKEVNAIFPNNLMMAWDTDLIYQYYRITGDNRLLLGGSTIWQTYASKPSHDDAGMYKRLQLYVEEKFNISPPFEYMWPGFIGVSKDIMPIAGPDKDSPTIYYVGAAAGLPWAAALGRYAADALIDNRSDCHGYFSPYRPFTFGPPLQKVLGNRITFALSHLTSLKSF